MIPGRSLRRPGLAPAVVLAVIVGGCASAGKPRPPEEEDYVFPSAALGEMAAAETQRFWKAWRDVLAGQAEAAEKQIARLLEEHRGLLPAETALAYARLRAGRFEEAARGFASVLERRSGYVPALVGAGSAAARLQRPDEALAFYRRAEAADPGEPSVQKRLPGLKRQAIERHVSAARAALESNEVERAVAEYQRALAAAPEVGGIRLELADLLVRNNRGAEAIKALETDATDDRQVLLRLGEILSGRSDHARALEVYRRLLRRDPQDAEARRRAFDARGALELMQMPEEYRRIPSAPRLTRADLAALVAVKVTALSRLTPGEARVATDISGSWAREHIIRVLAFDIMDVYPNHTFQPGATVRRGDLARAVGRVLELLKFPLQRPPVLKDMSGVNLYYADAARTVAAGLMDVTPDGSFEPWRLVSGKDAVAVIDGLLRLFPP